MAKRDLSRDPANLAAMWRKAIPIYQELKQTGLSDIALAAILGNMAQESSFDPNATSASGTYRGYVQNSKDIVRWITQNFGGYNHQHQMKYLVAGLTGKLPNAQSTWGNELRNRFNSFVTGMQRNIDVPRAVRLWESSYEKSGGQQLTQRINYANYFYNQIQSLPQKPTTTKVQKTQKPQTTSYPQVEQTDAIKSKQPVIIQDKYLKNHTIQESYSSNQSQNTRYPVRKRQQNVDLQQYYNGGKLLKRYSQWVN